MNEQPSNLVLLRHEEMQAEMRQSVTIGIEEHRPSSHIDINSLTAPTKQLSLQSAALHPLASLHNNYPPLSSTQTLIPPYVPPASPVSPPAG